MQADLLPRGAVRIHADQAETAREIVSLLRSAEKDVYYSSFMLNLDTPLCSFPRDVTMLKLFWELHERGVVLHLLYNAETAYENLNADALVVQLPPSAEVKVVHGSGEVPQWVQRIKLVKNKTFSNHHQKYICVDGAEMLVGGTDIDSLRCTPWLGLNADAFSWHEVSVVVPCTDRMYAFVRANFEAIQNNPPRPLLRGLQEYSVLTELIARARSCVHMEAQVCISAAGTANELLEHVVQRLHRAFKNQADDRFRFMLLTNMFQVDEDWLISWCTSKQLHWSRRYMRRRARQLGITPDFFKSRVFVGYLQHNGRHVKVHSNLLIQDGRRMVRSSSNFTDRSLSSFPCDNELGVAIQGHVVADFQQKIWRRYFGVPDHVPEVFSPEEAFTAMCGERGLVKRASFNKDNDTTRVPDMPVDAAMDLIHLGPWWGGKQKVEWKVTDARTPE
jgi:phosphatidylserine/phosphatidylglycerophosphate/cardiolipin synthase-like enzyme